MALANKYPDIAKSGKELLWIKEILVYHLLATQNVVAEAVVLTQKKENYQYFVKLDWP